MPRNLRKTRARLVPPTFAVTDLGGGEAELVLYGEVTEDEPRDPWTGEPTGGQSVSTERINRELDGLRGASHVTVRLNSCGGDYYSGLAIYNVLKALPASVTVRVEGIAASAASVIACAGDEVVVCPGSVYMVHEAAVGLMGYYQQADLDALGKDLEATNRSLASVYALRTGKAEQECRALMAEETWLVGQEIVEAGFATTMDVDEPAEQVEQEGEGELMVAGVLHDLTRFRHVPDLAARLSAAKRETPAVSAAVSDMEKPPSAAPEEKGVEHMTLDELREQHPDLVAEIEAAARKCERDRLAAIDEVADGIPADMVADAKYGETPRTAQELAFEAMRAKASERRAKAEADASAAASYVAAVTADEAAGGADAVEVAPNGGEAEGMSDVEQAKAEVTAAANIRRQMMGGTR